jgi:two-component system sensor histidine kinase MprB
VGAWIRRTSFRTRLGILVAAAVGVTLALAAVASYVAVRHQLLGQVDSTLESDVQSAIQLSPGGAFNPTRYGSFLRRTNNSFIQVIQPDGTVWYSSINPAMAVDASEASLAQSNHGFAFRSIQYDGSSYRVITEGGFIAPDGTPLALQIARPLSDIQHSLADLRRILWLVGLAGIAVAVGLGYLIGRATIRPVERLTAAAEHVAATQELDAKIDDDGQDELARLAKTFNSMLAALAASRSQQAQLISDAGHELRTPLTSLRTNIEVLMRAPDLPPIDRAELIADIEGQLHELTTLVGDVVDLAREEEQRSEPIEVRLDSIVERAVERAQRRAPGIAFDVHLTPGSVRTHPALLERAILNVLDNAVKWSPPGGRVGVWLQRGAYWTLDIRDQGPGISPADLPKVFDRFYRAQTARSLPGSGLGLAIVKQVVNSHGGSVTASCPPGGGTLIHIELPVVTEQEPPPIEQDTEAPDPASPPAAAGRPAAPEDESSYKEIRL